MLKVLGKFWNLWRKFMVYGNGQLYSVTVLLAVSLFLVMFLLAGIHESVIFGFLAALFFGYGILAAGTVVIATFKNSRWVQFEGEIFIEGKRYKITGRVEENTLSGNPRMIPVGESIKIEEA